MCLTPGCKLSAVPVFTRNPREASVQWGAGLVPELSGSNIRCSLVLGLAIGWKQVSPQNRVEEAHLLCNVPNSAYQVLQNKADINHRVAAWKQNNSSKLLVLWEQAGAALPRRR